MEPAVESWRRSPSPRWRRTPSPRWRRSPSPRRMAVPASPPDRHSGSRRSSGKALFSYVLAVLAFGLLSSHFEEERKSRKDSPSIKGKNAPDSLKKGSITNLNEDELEKI
ncbi:hypothetical protein OSTOST_17401 [Ostertagia ostertagi]